MFELGDPALFSFNTATLWGHAHDDAHLVCTKVTWNVNDFVPRLHSDDAIALSVVYCTHLQFLHYTTSSATASSSCTHIKTLKVG